DDQPAHLLLGAGAALLHLVEQREQPVERVLMAGEQNLFLVAEVVIEVALLHAQRRGDLLDGGAVVAELAERGGRAFQDLDSRSRVGVGIACTRRTPQPTCGTRPGWILGGG